MDAAGGDRPSRCRRTASCEERHSIVFDGDWNGGERIFRPGIENVIHLERLSRIDESGAAVPLRENKEMTAVDEYRMDQLGHASVEEPSSHRSTVRAS